MSKEKQIDPNPPSLTEDQVEALREATSDFTLSLNNPLVKTAIQNSEELKGISHQALSTAKRNEKRREDRKKQDTGSLIENQLQLCGQKRTRKEA